MVLFRAKKIDFFKSMCFMNELRKNGTFCDISLIVGTQVLKAHRCVLAAGSEYFNVLFLGQFAEASMNEINLSEVTKDIDSLEMLVNFLYTGEIDINADNLDTVAKLSSYFLMETVIKFLNKFIFGRLSLQTCLKYHLCAVEHGLTDVIAQTSQMLTARFHDCLILEQETLDVSPKELIYLHQNDVFQYCTPHDLLKFVVDWVKIGLTEQHISVGTEILDSVSCIENHTSLPLMHSREEALHAACEEMISTVSEVRLAGFEEFAHRASTLRNTCIGNRESKSKYHLRDLPTTKMPPTSTDEDKENVLIMLSPRKQADSNTMFNICAYVPSMRCWYYLKEMDHQSCLDIQDDSKDDWDFSMRHDQLVLAYCRNVDNPHVEKGNHMTFHDLNGEIWEEYEFGEELILHLKSNESWEGCSDCFVTGADNALYTISIINCPNEENPQLNEMFFRGCKFQDSDKSWQISFQTDKYQLAEFNFKRSEEHEKRLEFHASISAVSNEMLVTYCDIWDGYIYRSIIFVVNLSSETPVPVSILDSVKLDHSDEADCQSQDISVIIIQGKEQFFILYDISQLDEAQWFIEVKFEVKYNSNKLMTVETDKVELSEIAEVLNPVRGPYSLGMPDSVICDISDRESKWYTSGNHASKSKLTEVTVGRNRTPVIKSHPPPPFTSMTAAFAGTVSKDVLKKFKPVSFLGGNYSEKELNAWSDCDTD